MATSQRKCRRCGTCCAKGGPALHSSDRDLVLRGPLSASRLVTLRRGELVYHPAERKLMALTQEMIKVRGEGGWSCPFLSADRRCSIYEQRPLECRALRCWDTREIESLFLKDLLVREEVVESRELLEIIAAYDRQLPAGPLCQAIMEGGEGLQDLSARDAEFRRAVARNFGLTPVQLEFYLGRSVASLMEQLRNRASGK